MAAQRRLLRMLGFVAALVWIGGLAGCHDEDSGPGIVCSQVRGVWDVTTAPIEGYPYGFSQRWTIAMDGDCTVTITPEDRAYGGPFIGDTPGTGDATDGSLLASWSYRVSTYCYVASRLDASVVGNTFTGTISTLECLGGSDYPVTGIRH